MLRLGDWRLSIDNEHGRQHDCFRAVHPRCGCLSITGPRRRCSRGARATGWTARWCVCKRADGTVGWGESYCVEPRAIVAVFETLIAPLAKGKDAADEALLPAMQRILHNLGRSGPVVHAIAGPGYRTVGPARQARARARPSVAGRRSSVRASAPMHRCCSTTATPACWTAWSRGRWKKAIPKSSCTNVPPMRSRRRAARRQRRAPDGRYQLRLAPRRSAGRDRADGRSCAALDRGTLVAAGGPRCAGALEGIQSRAPGRRREPPAAHSELSALIARACAHYVQPSVIELGLSAAWALSRQCEGGPVACAPQVAFFGPGYLASLHLLAAQRTEASPERLIAGTRACPVWRRTVPITRGWVDVLDGPGLGADPEADLAAGRSTPHEAAPPGLAGAAIGGRRGLETRDLETRGLKPMT